MRKVLISVIVVLALVLAALTGFIWYQAGHIFVDGAAYAKDADVLDLRGQSISEAHYLTVQQALPDCEVIWDVPFQGGKVSSDVQQLTITRVESEDIRMLKAYFPKLQTVDASGCTDYPMLALLARELKDCQVSYQVDLGGTSADPNLDAMVLEQGSYTFETLLENLQYLPRLRTLHFPTSDLSGQEQDLLKKAYPQLEVTSTVEILGKEYDSVTTKLDLSAMKSADVESVSSKLALLPQLQEVELMGSSGSYLLLTDVQKLKNAAPEVSFHYSCDFYGVTVSTTDTEVTLKNLSIKAMPETGIAGEIRAMLDIMDNCQRIVVEGLSQYDKIWTRISSAELAEIREEYRDKTSVVWRVFFGENGSSLTDAEVIRAVYGVTDDNSKDLIYCENVRYLDLGHNEFLDYMDFLSGMTDLEVAILSGAPLRDLSPIAACKNLKFLEIANCQYIPNIDALKECTQLEMLNISFTTFEDLSPIMDLNLTHLTSVKNRFVSGNEPEAALKSFIDAHPDCWTVYEGDQPYGTGWRYDRNDKHLPWYAKMVTAFHYPNAYNNIGWYLPDDM